MKYDLIVIGGGPSGMMAAGRAGELGLRVLLLEKNPRLGSKLLITGKGRCNVTNEIDGLRELTEKFGQNGKFLFSALSVLGTKETVSFFENYGVKLKTERGGRIFPISDDSSTVLDALLAYLEASRVEVRTNIEVKDFIKKDNRIEKIVLLNGDFLEAKNYLIATGGKSYPGTGSTGDGYIWAEKLGHSIIMPIPALTPIVVKEKYVKDLEGLSLKNVEISLYNDKKKIDSRFGEAIFTDNGLSGPIVLDISKKVSLNKNNSLRLSIDFKPALEFKQLDERINRDFQENPNRLLKNGLEELLPKRIIPLVLSLSGLDINKKINTVTREERKKITHLLKDLSFEVQGVVGFLKAIVTAGGVNLTEVNPKTMRSKIIENLYFSGEVLDLDGPTGGYNLQVCWTTAYVAGSNLFKE